MNHGFQSVGLPGQGKYDSSLILSEGTSSGRLTQTPSPFLEMPTFPKN